MSFSPQQSKHSILDLPGSPDSFIQELSAQLMQVSLLLSWKQCPALDFVCQRNRPPLNPIVSFFPFSLLFSYLLMCLAILLITELVLGQSSSQFPLDLYDSEGHFKNLQDELVLFWVQVQNVGQQSQGRVSTCFQV